MPFVAAWKGHVPAGTVRNQVIGTHDIVPTFVELAGGKFEPDQMLDSVSLAPVLLGQRGDDQPVRQTLLDPEQPRPRCAHRTEPATARSSKAGAPKRTAQERQTAQNKAWNEIAKKGAKSGSDGMAHALREGPWKLVFNIEHDKPVALYNLADDLGRAEESVRRCRPGGAVKRMEKLYREIRASKRSTSVAP